MRLVIVTGMSGAGRGTALRFLEDSGYYCVDNMPVQLIEKFTQIMLQSEGEMERIALGVDVRTGQSFDDLTEAIDNMKEQGINLEVLFLESDDAILIKRYKETRRNHPLAHEDRIETGIEKERQKLSTIKQKADYIIDTSQLLTRELKSELESIFVNNRNHKNIYVTILSFGFKYGIPQDADLVFDVRFLPNPYYVDELKRLTGNDKEVRDFVLKYDEAGVFLDKLEDMIKFLIPNYILEGKNQLVIAIGCTGGKHRSVTLASTLYERLSKDNEYGLKLENRDIYKDALRGK